MQDLNKSTNKTENKISKSLSIFMAEVSNVTPLMILLNRIAKNEYDIKVLNNTQVKIQYKTSIKYTLIIQEYKLKKYKQHFHIYKIKEERNFRVVLKNIHPSINPEELK